MYIRFTQPKTPRLCNCQFVDTTDDNWDLHFTIIGHELALYNTLELRSALPFTQSCAKWLLTHPPFLLQSLTPCGPGPCPCPLRDSA